MPELPEVETIRMQLNQALTGLKIVEIEVLNAKTFQGDKNQVIGRQVSGVKRRAKILLIELSRGICLAIHLKLTGQLIYRNSKFKIRNSKLLLKDQKSGPFEIDELPNKYTRVVVGFGDNSSLYFNDLRKFGWIKVLKNPGECSNLPELAKLGPEAIDEKTFSLDYFKDILTRSKKPIKLIIMDQEKLAGVGNIYANEALFAAKIRPDRPANSLGPEEIKELRNSILGILKKAVENKGTSDRDEAYRQISGEKGSFQNYLQVYGRAGQKCPKCGGVVRRIALGGRGTFYCPTCQK